MRKKGYSTHMESPFKMAFSYKFQIICGIGDLSDYCLNFCRFQTHGTIIIFFLTSINRRQNDENAL